MIAVRIVLVLLTLAASISGCAKMSVRVDVLNAAYWSSPRYVDSVTAGRIANVVQEIREGRFDAQREALKQEVARTLTEMAKPPAAVSLQQVPELTRNFTARVDEGFARAQSEFDRAFSTTQEAARAGNEQARDRLMGQASQAFNSGAGILRSLVGRLSEDIRGSFQIATVTPPVEKLEQKTRRITEGLIGGGDILDDPRASAVVYAPDEFWTGRFNETLCAGAFGNTDCAVKMEGLGSFTIKGVRLDAAKITQATFSVARQAVQTIAAVYGVPLPKGGVGQPSTSESPSLLDLDPPVKRQREAAASLMQLRLARLAIIEAIIAQRQALTAADDKTRNDALGVLRVIVDANRRLLDPPAASTSGGRP